MLKQPEVKMEGLIPESNKNDTIEAINFTLRKQLF